MSQPLFGLVPAGQPVIVTPTETPTPNTFLYAIPTTKAAFSHIVIFLLPGIVLPEGSAAAIYLVTPAAPGQAAPNSRFLGGVGTGKESAIFKIGSGGQGQGGQENVVLGISLEPAESVAARMAEMSSATATGAGALVPVSAAADQRLGPSTLVLAQRIIKNAFNFLASFSGTAGQVEVVPLKAFEDWWRKFESKLRTDPGFLERDD
ncbi:hypothetical protein B0T19DRAFT_208018 [Cercophora scortea]|uniref:Hikeshi-like domain-containing protein n=1 Tax=Cercophora scortea TaxID=314031 RepID=A0AAE0IF21_9PEZI|nr:hypothetical protein B0T19DRAFT_208018 [Cercophora scortea]